MVRTIRWVLAVVAIVVVASAGVLAGEVRLAQRGRRLPDPVPRANDTPAGGQGGGPAADPVVVWLGDSTAVGVGASGPETTLPRQLAARLGRPIRLTVLARSGARVAEVLHRQLPLVAQLHPTEVIITVGANDTTHFTWRSHFRRDYDRLLAGLPTSARVVVLGVPDMGAPRRLPQPLRAIAGWRGRALDSDIRHLARRHGATYVDISGRTGPSFRRDPGRYFSADRFHPSDAGYRLWSEAVAAAVNDHTTR